MNIGVTIETGDDFINYRVGNVLYQATPTNADEDNPGETEVGVYDETNGGVLIEWLGSTYPHAYAATQAIEADIAKTINRTYAK